MYVVIAGGGKIGEYLANVLLESGNDVTIIEEDLETADRLSVVLQGRYLVIHGDGCDSKYQEDAAAATGLAHLIRTIVLSFFMFLKELDSFR